jgi:putative PIN family toxin of toxin-antitoxin system
VTSPDWVLDTNVLISAALSRQGPPHALVQHLLAHARLVFSNETFEELRSRLYRPKFDRFIALDMRERLLRDLSACARWVEIGPHPAWSRDPDDDKFIATALQASAVLVSGDQDLLTANAPQGLRILSPAQAWAEIQAAAGTPPKIARP